MATVCGIKLHAKTVYNLSGQYNLFLGGDAEIGMLSLYYAEKDSSRYYDIADMTLCDVPILYFYPGECEDDIEQAEYVHKKNDKNIYYFCVGAKEHGNPVKGRNLVYILTMDYARLIKYAKYGRFISPLGLFAKTAGVVPCIMGEIAEKIVALKRKLYSFKQKIMYSY